MLITFNILLSFALHHERAVPLVMLFGRIRGKTCVCSRSPQKHTQMRCVLYSNRNTQCAGKKVPRASGKSRFASSIARFQRGVSRNVNAFRLTSSSKAMAAELSSGGGGISSRLLGRVSVSRYPARIPGWVSGTSVGILTVSTLAHHRNISKYARTHNRFLYPKIVLFILSPLFLLKPAINPQSAAPCSFWSAGICRTCRRSPPCHPYRPLA